MTDFKLHSLDRLKAQLLVSGLQQENQPLYQVIHDLIGYLRQNITNTQSQISTLQGSGTTVINSLTQGFGPGFYDEVLDIPEMMPVQGPSGVVGLTGQTGIPGIDGIDGDDGFFGPPGPIGPIGLPGASSVATPIPLFDIPEIQDIQEPIYYFGFDINGGTGSHVGIARILDAGTVRANNSYSPASGPGAELIWSINQGIIQAYNRTTAAYQPMGINGSEVRVFVAGIQVAKWDSTGLLNQLFGEDVSGGLLRALGSSAPAAGVGVELGYNTGLALGFIQAYDRAGAAYKALDLSGSIINIGPSGSLTLGTKIDSIGRTIALSGFAAGATLTPPSFAVSQNNYNPTNFHTSTLIRLQNTSGSTVNITGMDAGVDGEIKILWNISGTGNDILCTVQDVNSSAANRYFRQANLSSSSPGGGANPLSMAAWMYSGTDSRWILAWQT